MKEMNWFEELENVKVDDFDKLSKLVDLAKQWPTCACGELCKDLPKYCGGDSSLEKVAPADKRLRDLGSTFFNHVAGMQKARHNDTFERRRASAIEIFHKIEARTAELLGGKS